MPVLAMLRVFGMLAAFALIAEEAAAVRDYKRAPASNSVQCEDGQEADLRQAPLNDDFQALLEGGQLFTGFILSTVFEQGKQGAGVQEDTTVEVKTPPHDSPTNPKLLGRFGNKNAVVLIWEGSADDKTIYVAFTPARGDFAAADHARKILNINSPEPSEADDGMVVHAYLKKKFDALWSDEDSTHGGLSKFLKKITKNFGNHKFLFCGLSHGAALTQLAAYRFAGSQEGSAVMNKNNFYAVSWNSYLWTNQIGAAKVHARLGDRLLNLVTTRRSHKTEVEGQPRRYWDPSSTHDMGHGYVAMTGTRLLESGCTRASSKQAPCDEQICGYFLACDPPACPGQRTLSQEPLQFNHDFQKLHYAPNALKGMKRAMLRALEMRSKA